MLIRLQKVVKNKQIDPNLGKNKNNVYPIFGVSITYFLEK